MNGTSWVDGKVKALIMAVLVLAGAALASYTYYTYKQTRIVGTQNVISVSGKGEIQAKPDIATFSFSVDADGKDATEAQQKSADAMNGIVSYLKGAGVDEKDIKTSNYSLSPKYRYEQALCTQFNCPPGKQILDGYTVDQTVTVKVRQTDKAGDLISQVGDKGATNISGLSFTIDDQDKLMRDARDLAIKDAKDNADKLAAQLGISLGRLVTYSEDQGNVPVPMMYEAKAMDSMVAGRAVSAPSIPTGENTIRSNVTLVYEIK